MSHPASAPAIDQNTPAHTPGTSDRRFLEGGGEMGALIRAKDWSSTLLGPIEEWSPSLRVMVSQLLANRFPLLLWWGPEYASIYNDAYRPILGTKHPSSLGQPVSECWAEIWHVLKPLIDTPFSGGPATWMEDIELEINRHGFVEETHFTISYSAVPDETAPRGVGGVLATVHEITEQVIDTPFSGGPATWMEDIELEINRHGFVEETHFTISYSAVPDETAPRGVGGVLATVHEITEQVIGQRRLGVLRDLGACAVGTQTAEAACEAAARILSSCGKDVPFGLMYLVDADGHRAHLAGITGAVADGAVSPTIIDLDEVARDDAWPVRDVLRSATRQTVTDLADRFDQLPPGPWSDAPRDAVLLPLASNVPGQPVGVLVAGVSPRHALDDQYLAFLDLVAAQISMAIGNARAYEEQRRRSDMLAALDRAKTTFFSNVSHEFRTPLTLLLSPLEDLLTDGATLAPSARQAVDVAHRNALRLLKLVNSLLDFSRIEAGRARAAYEAVDLAALTADIASSFRSACERAGISLVVDCPPLQQMVHVDRDMWENVVLNLLSNAFKFTFEGSIIVRLRGVGDRAVLEVCDTGVGIPKHELERVFDRFHRIEGQRSRTHEGSGIGLALVHELVKLHGGTIRVESEPERGAAFIVELPFGSAHLPSDRVDSERRTESSVTRAASYVEEALRWLPEPVVEHPHHTQRVLVADDNADMRAYVRRLLGDQCDVDVVADGQLALEAIRRHRPDLVLADVMMPRLDGFGLLRAIRDDPDLRDIPVIMLSARAGEESRVEGLAAGADDYLVKPFSARELVARVNANLALTRIRREATAALRARTAQYETLLEQAPLGVYLVDADFRIREVNPVAAEFFGAVVGDALGRDFADVIHVLWSAAYADELVQAFRDTLTSGHSFVCDERGEVRADRGTTEYYEWRLNRIVLPDGRFGVVCYFRDISEQVRARRDAEAANRAKSDFLAAMSHELRTPLNAIAGYVELTELGIYGPVTADQLQVLQRVQRSQQHLLRLINDILNFAKLEAGRVEYQMADVPLAAAVAEVTAMIEPQRNAKSLTAQVEIAPDVVVRADREKLEQIVLNVLTNAIKFTESGGSIRIDIAERDGAPRDFVFLRVTDTGCGVARDRQDIIFDPFVQVPARTTRTQEGTGLGLAISRDLARAMNGDLRVRSTEGKGATFTLALRRPQAEH